MRALAITGAQRSPTVPDMPTVAEERHSRLWLPSWQGWFMPAKTPRDIVAHSSRKPPRRMAMPDMQARLKAMGNEPVGSTTEAFEGDSNRIWRSLQKS